MEEAFEIPNGEVKTFDVIKVPVFLMMAQEKLLLRLDEISLSKSLQKRF